MNQATTTPRFAPIPLAVFVLSAMTFWAAEGWLAAGSSATPRRFVAGLLAYTALGLLGWLIRAALEPSQKAETVADGVDPGALAMACAWPLGLVVPQWLHLRLGRDLPEGLVTSVFLAGGGLLPALAVGLLVFRFSRGRWQPRTVTGVLLWLGLAGTLPYAGLACMHAHRFVRPHLGGDVPGAYWAAAAAAGGLAWAVAAFVALPPVRALAVRIGSFTVAISALLLAGLLSLGLAPLRQVDEL